MAYFDRIIIFQLLVLHRCSSYTATSYCRHMCQRSLTTLLNDWYNRRPQWALELNEVERWSICDRGRDNTSRIKLLLISGCDVMWYLFIQFPGLGHQMVVYIDAGMPTTIYEFWNHEVCGGGDITPIAQSTVIIVSKIYGLRCFGWFRVGWCQCITDLMSTWTSYATINVYEIQYLTGGDGFSSDE